MKCKNNLEIKFMRGDNHYIQFKFKDFLQEVDFVYFTVRDNLDRVILTKKSGDGIEYDGEYYVISILPEDTNKLNKFLDKMVYDIEIMIAGEKFTVAKDRFIIEKDVTTPSEEG